jgi:hypothetical protein
MSEPIVKLEELQRSARAARYPEQSPYPHFSDARDRWMKEYSARHHAPVKEAHE